LENPKAWTLSEIVEELATQSQKTPYAGVSFQVSFALASRVVRSLEEELLVMRRNSSILVPEPRRLLSQWAQEYKDRYKRYLRRSFTVPNPFGINLESVRQDLDVLLKPQTYAFSGAAAATQAAPFVDVDTIDLYISDEASEENLRNSVSQKTGVGPELRVIPSFDDGVFLYSHSLSNQVPVVSYIQTYLDLFARGGRDLKQADYLLDKRIQQILWRR
jgi:hypothetical protein